MEQAVQTDHSVQRYEIYIFRSRIKTIDTWAKPFNVTSRLFLLNFLKT